MRFRAEARGGAGSSRVARIGVLMALASVLGLAETLWLPVLPIPGMRLGLANVAVVIALELLGPAAALLVSLGRVVVVGMATGSLLGPVGILSVTAALASWCVMSLLWRCGDRFTPIGWSVAGSASSVCAQLALAGLVTGSAAPLYLAPAALALSLPSGLAVGLLAGTLISRVSRLSVQVVG
jgi:heptaprenyl diphosphate synthase